MLALDLLQTNDIIRSPSGQDYQIVSLIGRGGMGAVYRARRLADGAIWALKEMRPAADLPQAEIDDNRSLFDQEAKLMQSLSHPHIPIVAETFVHDGRPILIMEYVPGQTLEDRMREANAPLLEQQVLGYGIQVARVLSYLHTRTPPIIYRDLKPSNMILTPDGVIKIVDFGVARTYKAKKSKDTVAMGSAGYAPPEQYGKGQTDARSDMYALGATLLHLLTNMPPIPLQTPTPGSISKINPSTGADTEAAIIKAMDLTPNNRFATVADFEQALHRCLETPFVDPVSRAAPPPPAMPAGGAVRQQPAPQPAPQPASPRQQPAPQPAPPRQQPAPQRQQPAPQPAPQQTPLQPVQPAVVGGKACDRCGRVNKPNARFCAGCGTPLEVQQPPRLLIRSPRQSWELRLERLPVRIGRRDPRQRHFPEVDLAEHDRGVASRNHAIIDRDGAYYRVTDLGSTNGTRINGVAIAPNQPRTLRSGDRITIGEVEIEFRWT